MTVGYWQLQYGKVKLLFIIKAIYIVQDR